MPALTRFSLTDYTEKTGGKVRIRLRKRGGGTVDKQVPLVVSSSPPRYELLAINEVGVIGVDYVLEWEHPLWGTRYHMESMDSGNSRIEMAQAVVEVNVYCDPTTNPPTDDCFQGTHWCDVYMPDGRIAPGPWKDATLAHCAADPIPPTVNPVPYSATSVEAPAEPARVPARPAAGARGGRRPR